MSHPTSWPVSLREGYLTRLESSDRRLAYDLYAEDYEGSFDDFREDTEPRERDGQELTVRDVTVDGRSGFYVHRVYEKQEPSGWSGETWCAGCVERDYYLDWKPQEVLHVATEGVSGWTRYEDTVERIVKSLEHI